MGFGYVRDLHSSISSAMARHSLNFTGGPLNFRAKEKVDKAMTCVPQRRKDIDATEVKLEIYYMINISFRRISNCIYCLLHAFCICFLCF